MKLILLSKVKIFIYGIYDSRGKCLYVGQTAKPYQRRKAHTWKRGKFHGCDFRVIRVTGWRNSNRLEKQIGLAYQRRGECKCNQRFHKCEVNFWQRNFPGLKARIWAILDKQDFRKYHVQEIARSTGIKLQAVYDYRQRHGIPVKKWIKPTRKDLLKNVLTS